MDRSPFFNHQSDPPKPAKTPSTLAPVTAFLKRHLAPMIGIFLVSALVFSFVALTKEPTYSARAGVLVKFGREFIYTSETGEQKSSDAFSWQEIVNSEIEILRSRELAESTVKALGLQLYPEIFQENDGEDAFPKAVQAFRDSTNVTGVPDSGVMRISFTHGDPKLAADAVNLLLDHFKDKHLAIFSDYPIDFVREQTEQYRERMKVLDTSITDYRKSHHIFDVDQQRRLLLEQRSDLEAALRQAEGDMTAKDQELLALEMNPSIAASMVPAEEARRVSLARAQLLDFQLAERSALLTHTNHSRTVEGIRKDIELVKEFVEEGEKKLNTMASATLLQARNVLLTQKTAAAAQIEKIELNIQEMDVKNFEVQTMERKREVLAATLVDYEARLEDALATEDLDRRKIINVRVIEDAAPPVKAEGLSRPARLVLGLFVSALITMALAFLLELLRAPPITGETTWSPLSPSRQKVNS